jgi:hypothetical protein
VTEFPELQQALVHAAGRRYGRAPRAWRVARPVLVAAVCVAAVVGALALNRDHEQERSAAPTVATTGELTRDYSVFRRPATNVDHLPTGMGSFGSIRLDEHRVRRVVKDGKFSVYLAGGTMTGREALCALLGDQTGAFRYGCNWLGIETDGGLRPFVFKPGDGQAGVIVAVAQDGVDELLVTSADHSTVHVPVRDNVAFFVPGKTWPESVAWDGTDGRRHVTPA